MKPRAWLLAFILTFAASVLRADAVKDREGAVRGDRARMENDARWIYNDVDRGFAEARRTGRPLLVVLRCVPCLSCVGLDAQVLTEPALAPLLDELVFVGGSTTGVRAGPLTCPSNRNRPISAARTWLGPTCRAPTCRGRTCATPSWWAAR